VRRCSMETMHNACLVSGHEVTGCGKTQSKRLCNKGTAFSRADKVGGMSWASAPEGRFSVRLTQLREFFRSLLSRAATGTENRRALAPAGYPVERNRDRNRGLLCSQRR
jgi:hypothetical protein